MRLSGCLRVCVCVCMCLFLCVIWYRSGILIEVSVSFYPSRQPLEQSFKNHCQLYVCVCICICMYLSAYVYLYLYFFVYSFSVSRISVARILFLTCRRLAMAVNTGSRSRALRSLHSLSSVFHSISNILSFSLSFCFSFSLSHSYNFCPLICFTPMQLTPSLQFPLCCLLFVTFCLLRLLSPLVAHFTASYTRRGSALLRWFANRRHLQM